MNLKKNKKDKKSVLGKGLSAILGDSDSTLFKQIRDNNIGAVCDIDINVIDKNPKQPRLKFNTQRLKQLSDSIKQLGIVQPITVRKQGNNYQLISGERRLKASKMAGLKKIPAYVRIADDNKLLQMALVENIQREDLDPIEIAISYKKLIKEYNLTQENIGEIIGKDRSTITNHIRLLKLDPIVQMGIRDKIISIGHGKVLISCSNKQQVELYHKTVKYNLSVRKLEELLKNQNVKQKSNNYKKEVFEELSKIIGKKSFIKYNKAGKGNIIIPFESKKDLDGIIKLFN